MATGLTFLTVYFVDRSNNGAQSKSVVIVELQGFTEMYICVS